MLNAVLGAMVSRFVGLWNLDDGMLLDDGIKPMGVGLQEPLVIWSPAVRGVLARVRAQKLAKLFVDTTALDWPVTGGT